MCGIAGIVGDCAIGEAERQVRRMLATLERRGPDGEGIEQWPDAILGHRRLAVFDLSEAGRQPMMSPEGRVGVVFNGAVYNFRELRKELAVLGYRFRSGADTEVLVHGYDAWGIEGLVRRLHGMFAFGLWDSQFRTLYLVRDRLGVKPLLYMRRDDSIAFASSARALRVAGFASELDDLSVAEFLDFGFVTEARSIYRGVCKVPPATIIKWNNGRARSWSYWEKSEASLKGIDFDEAVARTEVLFLDAVQRRLHADVPVGALLSGGVDSGLVCWGIATLGADVTAYTVAIRGHPEDESAEAHRTARRLGLQHKILDLEGRDAPLDELTSAYGEPFACASALGMLAISKMIRPAATVLLTGDGGDDVFLGYPQHRFLSVAERLARGIPTWVADQWYRIQPRVPRVGLLKRGANFLNYATGGLGAYTQANEGFLYLQTAGMLGDRLRTATVQHRTVPWSITSARHVLADYLAYDYRNQFVSEYLTKIDGATMHHALEARSPFLDQHIWEYAGSLPTGLRLHRFRLKAILRELARRHIGNDVARSQKRGFRIPVQRWLVSRWRDDFVTRFEDPLLARNGWVKRDAVLSSFTTALHQGSAPLQLWYLYVFERWMAYEMNTGDGPVNVWQ